MTELSDSILNLRAKGKTYSEIQQELGCSKSTISFHCGVGQKDKNKMRAAKWKVTNPSATKIYEFRRDTKGPNEKLSTYYSSKERLRFKFVDFNRNANLSTAPVSIEEGKAKLEENPVCYLTGKPIDLDKLSTWELDHIVPRSKGGNNSLGNMGLASKEANRAKGNLSVEEFVKLCYDVCNNFGLV